MKLIALLLLGSAVYASDDDVMWEKRNQQYQKALSNLRKAQTAQRDLITPWIQECEAKGMKLNADGQGFLKCFPAPAPAPAPAKPPAQ